MQEQNVTDAEGLPVIAATADWKLVAVTDESGLNTLYAVATHVDLSTVEYKLFTTDHAVAVGWFNRASQPEAA